MQLIEVLEIEGNIEEQAGLRGYIERHVDHAGILVKAHLQMWKCRSNVAECTQGDVT
jgi:hypothetical protein